MSPQDLPFGDLFILALAIAICAICILISFVAFKMDQGDLTKISEVVYFQEKIHPMHPIYVISIRIRELMTYDGITDLIFRLRGTTKDSPVILYRNHNCDRIRSGHVLNLGVALPYELGSLVEVDLACDNSKAEESDPIMVISDVFVRQLPRTDTKGWAKMNESTILGASATDLFENLTNKVRTWAGLETLCVTGGVGVVGISVTETGREQTLRARDVALSLSMEEESEFLKRRNITGFRPQHYFFSVTREWHDVWSDFSRFDVVAVVCLDLVAMLVIISLSFVYKLERFIGATSLSTAFTQSKDSPFKTFDLYDLKQVQFSIWLSKNSGSLIEAVWVAFISGLVVVPLSLLWAKLFRLVGGKGFQHALKLAQTPIEQDESPEHKNGFLRVSAGFVRGLASPSTSKLDNMTPSAHLMLRTLECKNVLTASTVLSSRRLRMEPLIANCPPDDITARSVAYVRTKMSRLRDDAIPSGKTCVKHPHVLHESHTQSTDSPEMPLPTKIPGEKGEVVRIARYCERLVQQASQQIKDNSVIAECFEIDSKPKKREDDKIDPKKCCPRRCCGCPPVNDASVDKLKKANESFSNATFFNEEDALSVHELMTQFPNVLNHEVGELNEDLILEEFADAQMAMMGEEEESEEKSLSEEQIYTDDDDEVDSDSWIPSPSAKLRKERQERRNTDFSKELRSKVKEHRDRQTKLLVDSGTIEKSPHSLNPRDNNNLFCDETNNSFIPRNKRRTPKKTKGSGNSVRFDFIRNISSSETKSSYTSPRLKTGKKYPNRRRFRKHKSKKAQNAPCPSGAPDIATYSDDWVSAKSHFSSNMRPLPPVPKKLPLKGTKVKIVVFLFLCCLQLAELYFLTAFETEINSLFGKREGANRRHGAVFCVGIGVLLYFVCIVHLIALASFFIKHLQNRNNYSEYTDQYTA